MRPIPLRTVGRPAGGALGPAGMAEAAEGVGVVMEAGVVFGVVMEATGTAFEAEVTFEGAPGAVEAAPKEGVIGADIVMTGFSGCERGL